MTGNEPLVSVLMPYYNGKQYVKEAIDSVINQTYKNIELIIVDDNSSDPESKNYIKSICEDLEIKLIYHQTNKGVAKTILTAFQNCSGELISFIAQDDIFLPDKTKLQVESLIENNLDAVYTPFNTIDRKSGKIQKANIKKIIRKSLSANIKQDCLMSNITGATVQGLLVRKYIVEEALIQVWCSFMLDDWPVNAILWTKYKTKFLDKALVLYRKHSENTSLDIWKWFAPKLEVPARIADDDAKIEAIGRRLLSCSVQLQKKGDNHSAARLAFAAAMLLEIPKNIKRLSKAIYKIPFNIRKKIAKQLLNNIAEGDKININNRCNWDNFSSKINTIISSGGSISDWGAVFFELTQSIEGNDKDKITLAGTVLTGKICHTINNKILDQKVKFLKSQLKYDLRCIFYRF